MPVRPAPEVTDVTEPGHTLRTVEPQQLIQTRPLRSYQGSLGMFGRDGLQSLGGSSLSRPSESVFTVGDGPTGARSSNERAGVVLIPMSSRDLSE